MTKAVDLLLESFKKRFGKYPNFVQFDEGKEFYTVGVRDLLKGRDVNYFSTKSDKKAAIVERFNRTLKTMMWKDFYSKGTYDWIDVLDDLVKNYNNTKHGSILMKPKDVNKTNENVVWVPFTAPISESFPIQNSESAIPLVLASIKAFSEKVTKPISRKKFLRSQRFLEGIQPFTSWKTTKAKRRTDRR